MPDYLYNIPNATNIADLMSYPNDVTGGWFWNFILIGLFIVIFGMQKSKNVSSATSFVTTSFFLAIITLMLSLIPNLISAQTLMITMLMAVFGVIILLLHKPKTIVSS